MSPFTLIGEPKPVEPFKPSRAVLVSGGGRGFVLHYDGTAISWHVEEYSPDLDELGLDDAPDGISIWEGEMGSVRVVGPEGEDWDFEVTGKFRQPTAEEWDAIKSGDSPWPEEEQQGEEVAP